MKLCDDVITVFNSQVDPDTGGNVWTGTVLTGVRWWATDACTVDASKGGLVAASKVTVRIPVEAVPSGTELAIMGGDIIVRGDASATQNPTPAGLKAAWPGRFMTVLAVTDNTGAPHAPHWRVTGT